MSRVVLTADDPAEAERLWARRAALQHAMGEACDLWIERDGRLWPGPAATRRFVGRMQLEATFRRE